jgi:tRNA uridine 5-carbamoylmethylation protein Kti12
MNNFVMLIGLPGSGKSTSLRQVLSKLEKDSYYVYSTDDHIQSVADSLGTSYNMSFKDNIAEATKLANVGLIEAIKNEKDIFWDQTNLSVKSRKEKLKKIPNNYKKIAIVIRCSNIDEHMKRLSERAINQGKTIPLHVLESMKNSFVEPSYDEGFDEIFVLEN